MRLPTALFCVLALGAALCPPVAAKTFKLGTLAPEGTPYYDILRDLGEAWKEASGGAIELKIYPGGIAGDEADMVRKMRIGQLHAAAITGGGLADIAPEIRALQMPMMFRSLEELDYARAGVQARIEAAFEARGFKILTWGDAGWLYFFTTAPVVHPDDLKHLKLFTWTGNTTFIEAWKDLGYQPVPMAATEIHLGLASGLIGAMAVPPIAALSFQWFGLANHMTDLKFVPLVGAVVVVKREWDALDDELKPALLAAAEEAGRRFQSARTIGEEATEVMQTHGLVVHEVPEDVLILWERRARGAWARIIGEAVPADLVAEVERLRDEYRAR